MVNYNCQRCGYTTNIKTIMLRHYNRKKVCNPVLDDIDINLLKEQLLKDQYNKSSVNPVKSSVNPDKSSLNLHNIHKKSTSYTQKIHKKSKIQNSKFLQVLQQQPTDDADDDFFLFFYY